MSSAEAFGNFTAFAGRIHEYVRSNKNELIAMSMIDDHTSVLTTIFGLLWVNSEPDDQWRFLYGERRG